MTNPERRCLLITGTVGAGKTTTAYAIGDLLRERNISHAVIDLDEFHRLWPPPEGDPFKQQVELANLRAVAANYRAAGATYLVLAGVVLHDRTRYEKALGEPVLLCRLRPQLDLVGARLIARHEPGDERDWHVRRAPELEKLLDAAATADLTIDVADETPAQVAARVLADTRFAE
ncbi:MAG TPA: hypothetical protein VG502_07725 [Flexivirga sp.]|uniref:hypothetical protein n=1 Tax=Flexivirga sp. TaxID=1962927 RepID=UPI002C8EDC02|nr:hypothetical protein [Flexivirga sp.]HWC22169.1 hypothetical protein [Flexivirga sp.]